jgi:hypothetical protein
MLLKVANALSLSHTHTVDAIDAEFEFTQCILGPLSLSEIVPHLVQQVEKFQEIVLVTIVAEMIDGKTGITTFQD